MKKFLFVVLALAIGSVGFAKSPIQPEVQKQFDSMVNIVRVPYDFAVNGGAISTIALNASLPANVIVRQIYINSLTTPTSAGTPAVTLTCGGVGLLSSTDVTTYTSGALYPGKAVGTAATMIIGPSSQCVVNLVIATAALTAGKFTFYIEYIKP